MLISRNRYRWIDSVLGLCLLFTMLNALGAQKVVPDGLWLQIDDHDGRPLSIIRLRSEGKQVFGSVEEIFLPHGVNPPLCMLCPGDKARKPIVGMQIMSGSQSTKSQWDGEILDPASGRVYKGRLTLAADNKTIQLRGYVGIPLFGRTQIWRRFSSN